MSTDATALGTTSRARTWRITTTNGTTAYGYLPAWADDDPSETDLDPRALSLTLTDIVHHFPFTGLATPLVTQSDDDPDADDGIASYFCEIECHPHPDHARPDDPLTPVLLVQITQNHTTTCHEPAELAALIARLRAHTDFLAHDVLPAFRTIHEDWASHQREPTKQPS